MMLPVPAGRSTALAVSLLAILGCGGNVVGQNDQPASPLVGTWQGNEGDTITFNSDGTVTNLLSEPGCTLTGTGTWSASATALTTQFESCTAQDTCPGMPPSSWAPVTCTYTLANGNDTLILTACNDACGPPTMSCAETFTRVQ